jgi:hypothetical protein
MNKTCTVCEKSQDKSQFHKSSNNKDGHRSQCKDCCKEYNRSRKDKQKEYNKEYRQNNSEKLKSQKKDYYNSNKEYFAEKNYQLRTNLDPEKRKEYNKKYYNNMILRFILKICL